MKMVNAFLIIFFIFLLSVRITYAKDFSIVLDDTTPSFQQVDNFFNSDDMLWAPGKEETKSLIITNNTNIAQYILFSSINKDDPILVSQAMHITISNKSGDELYSNSLFAFINQGEKLIDSVEPYSTETLIFNIKMYDTAGNIYQNSYINFDLGIDLLDPIEYITPTPILCNTSIPPPISQLTLGKIGSDQVLVEWNKGYRDDEKESKNQDSITGYSVMYATNNSFNPNTQRYIGKTNQFIVKYVDLKSNRYYFKVKTVNNCKEGDWSSVISVGTAETTSISAQTTPTTTFIVSKNDDFFDTNISPLPPTNFPSNPTANIMPNKSDTEATQSTVGKVQGITTNKCIKFWWPVLLVQTIVLFFIMFGKHPFRKTKTSIAVLTSLLLYIYYLVINPCLSTKYGFIVVNEAWYLNYFWILNILILLQIYLFNKWWTRQDSNL